ncbi:stalk domain-containing protein [Ferviditalea candida]|uniref:Stalk domain-containing protein n=1 Tax=Ferviditalea candida TaxID=3108399 RepID=A0ABU5ZKH3_9BACL|nr:stalk domain-containing protein [Paenibacillaceae bacterium T2]
MLNFKQMIGLTLAVTLATTYPIVLPHAIAAQDETQAQAAQPQRQTAEMTALSEQPITSGAVLKQVLWKGVRNGQEVTVNGNIIVVDLKNPNVKLDVMTGVNNQFTKKQTVEGMAKETGAVAGTNGDFYVVQAEGAPIGPEINDGTMMSSPSMIQGMYAFGITKDRQPVIDSYSFSGTVKADNGRDFPLTGINKTYYWLENGQHSHVDSLYIYTHAWGQIDRANDGATTPTEVLVKNGVIQQIAYKSVIQSLPPENGYILRAAGKGADFVKNNLKVGEKLQINYHLVSMVTKKDIDPNQFVMMIGGHTILVDQGKAAAFSRSVSSLAGYRSRTGIGYSKDGRYAYIMTVDNSGDSKGMSLKEFQDFMVMAGVWKGINLDGGGSTQMVARPLGDFNVKLADQTEYATARKVVNGLGVYSTAPKGQVKGLIVQGESMLFINESTAYNLKAYDQYFNPVRTDQGDVRWSLSKPIGSMNGNLFTAAKAGSAVLTAAMGQAKEQRELLVVGKDQIARLGFDVPNSLLAAGGEYPLKVTAETVDGRKRTVPSQLVDWELIGFQGTVKNGSLTVSQVNKDTATGQILATYDGFSAIMSLPQGIDKTWADFDAISYPVTFEQYPGEVQGTARLVTGLPGAKNDNDQALYIEYDFRKGSGTKAAYASFGDNGVPVEGRPIMLKASILGDNSLNWIRAEVTDRNGQVKRIDLTQHLDWYGWKEVSVDLSSYHLDYPIAVKRLYVVSPEQGQDEREAIGAIAIDNVRFQYLNEVSPKPNVKVQMAVGRNRISVDGKEQSLDQAPVVVKGTTMIPIRFFVNAMGGDVRWDAKEKKATVLMNNRLVQLWINQAEVNVDGQRIKTEVSPLIMNLRTMLPLRLISESLGWKVNWDPSTKSITLE